MTGDVDLAVAGAGPTAVRGGGVGRFRTFARQALFFVAIGAVVTAGNALLYLTLRQWLAIVPANALAIATTTLLSTELNRRLTFAGARSRHGQVAVQNLLVFGYYFAYSGATLWLLHVLVDRPTTQLEAATVFAASALGGIARFALLRWWVFTARRG